MKDLTERERTAIVLSVEASEIIRAAKPFLPRSITGDDWTDDEAVVLFAAVYAAQRDPRVAVGLFVAHFKRLIRSMK